WNVSSADAAPNHPVAQDFIDNIQGQVVMDSAIILMHSSSGHEETVKALPEIIRILREKGYTFGVITPMTPQPW
ncbi:MAG: polysaccharide deacetylase, partial [Selenomonas sp.]|nr:polysaccharide deacetylase [Selenomonas sp.]